MHSTIFGCRWLPIIAAGLLLMSGSAARAAEPPPLEAYGKLPSMEQVALSASGERIAYISVIGEVRKLVVQQLPSTALGVWTLGDIKLRSVEWVGDEYVIVTLSQTLNMGWDYGFEHELFRPLVINLRDSSVQPLLRKRNTFGASFGSYGYRKIDGQWYAFQRVMPLASGDLQNSVLAKVRLDDQSIEYKGSGNTDFTQADWLVGTDGQILATSRYQDKTGNWRLQTGSFNGREIVRTEDSFRSNQILGYGRTADTVLYSYADRKDHVRYMEAPLQPADGKLSSPIEVLEEVTTDGVVFDPKTFVMIGYVAPGDQSELVMFDARLKARVLGTRKAFPGLRTEFISWNDDIDRFVVKTDGPGDAGTYWLVNIATGRADEIGYAYRQIPAGQIASSEMIDYKAGDGLALRGVLTLPPQREAAKLPLVVMPHGGPQARDYPGFDWWAQAFASRGYAVWQPNFRGSSGYGSALLEAGYGQIGGRMQTDISDGVAELARRGIVDPARACIVGASYGGYAALAGVTLQQGLYRCAVSVAGVTDWIHFLYRVEDRSWADSLRYWQRFLGIDGPSDSRLKTLSPVNLAGRADAPVLLIHGRDDTVVAVEQSKSMRKALEKAGKPVEYLEMEGEDHWMSREQTRLTMLKASVEFVQRFNPATVPATLSPDTASQDVPAAP